MPESAKGTPGPARLVFLGGLGEVGRNMAALEMDGSILLLDTGLSFPEDDMPGVDLVLPDWDWLRERSDTIVGAVLTHGHEDHVGALPYMLKEFELDVYAKGILVEFGMLVLLLTALSFILQVLLNQKYVAFLGVMLWFILNPTMRAMGYEHRLYRYGMTPPSTWSDMNGYGHFAWPLTMFNTYWILFAAVFLVFCHLMWVRGTEKSLQPRLSIARQRFSKPVAAALIASLTAFVATGCTFFDQIIVAGRFIAVHGTNRNRIARLNADGTLASIEKVVTEGVAKPKKMPAPMPPKGGGQLTDAQVKAVAAYVYSLSRPAKR